MGTGDSCPAPLPPPGWARSRGAQPAPIPAQSPARDQHPGQDLHSDPQQGGPCPVHAQVLVSPRCPRCPHGCWWHPRLGSRPLCPPSMTVTLCFSYNQSAGNPSYKERISEWGPGGLGTRGQGHGDTVWGCWTTRAVPQPCSTRWRPTRTSTRPGSGSRGPNPPPTLGASPCPPPAASPRSSCCW